MIKLKRNEILIAVLSFLMLFGCNENKESTIDTKPNVIIVITDDQGYGDLGHHGNPYIQTPNLDSFAAASLELTNFHVGTTCAPTRAGIMTGRNANRNNAWHTIAGCSILLEDEETIAEIFAKNDYETAMFGKWHLGDNYPFRPHDRGFNNAFYHGGGGVNQTPDYWNNDYFDDTYFRNGVPEKTEGYCTDVWFNETIDYIDSVGDKPFFTYLALNAAHSPFNVPEKYAEIYKAAPLTETQKRFNGMITNIDDNFGRLIAHLKKTGDFDNTIIIFTTDNGTAAGISKGKTDGEQLGYNAGLRGTKGSHYEGGHRVPFFISWPDGDILKAKSSDELTAHVDLLPTLSDLVGLEYAAKKPLDGTSIAHILRGEATKSDRMLVIDTQRNQLPEKGRNSCVMSSDWRLIDGKELYNINGDIGQKNNVADEHPEIVSKMNAFYDDWWASLQDDIRYAEIPMGNSEANPVLITVHDMHTKDALPWNQKQTRDAKFHPSGYYSVKIEEKSEYSFRLFRYPPETGFAINESVPAIAGSAFRDELPLGTELQVSSAMVQIGDVIVKAPVDDSKPYVELKSNLELGSYELRSTFYTAENKEFTPYYIEIEKL